MPLKLSERQQTTAAVAVTILSTVIIVAAVGVFLWMLGAFVNRFSSVFLPLAVAGVGALVLNPYFDFLTKKLRLPRVLAVVVVFLSMLLPILGFGWVFGAALVRQASDLIASIPEWWEKLAEFAQESMPRLRAFIEKHDLEARLRNLVEGRQGDMLGGLQVFGAHALSAGAGLVRGMGAIAGWVVLPVYFAFFLIADPTRLANTESLLPFLKPETRRDLIYLGREFINILVAFFRGQLIIAFLQGVLYAVGFSIVGLSYGMLLGLLLGFLNVIPYLGSIIGLGITLPLALFQDGGGTWTMVWVLVVFITVQAIESYLLTPRIMGDRTGLHPMAIIVAVFFWGSALGGVMGMILAIPLTAFLVVFWRLAKERYIGELV